MFKSDIACNAIPAISASNQISGMPISASNIKKWYWQVSLSTSVGGQWETLELMQAIKAVIASH